MDILVETFLTSTAAATRKAQLAANWDVAAEGGLKATDDLVFRVWGAGQPPAKTSEQALDPAGAKYLVVFKPKAAAPVAP